MKKFVVFFIIFFAGVWGTVEWTAALSISSDKASFATKEEVFQAYRQQKEIGVISSIQVPTVVEVPLDGEEMDRWDFAVYDVSADLFEPTLYHTEPVRNAVTYAVTASSRVGTVRFAERMADGNVLTYTDMMLPDQGEGRTSFTIITSRPITSSGIVLVLDDHVALPSTVEIRAVVDSQMRIVFKEDEITENSIRFPRVISSQWLVLFSYAQPLRVSELRILDENTPMIKKGVRFLAQPSRIYRLYLDSDRSLRPFTNQSANLSIDEGVLRLFATPSMPNPLYRPADIDEDGIPDKIDNCVLEPNFNQEDKDRNKRGDACDDFDKDAVLNSKDNCLDNPNRDQRDEDGDGLGDVCDKEESRLTEKYPWIPWIGIGIAGVVLVVLLFLTARSMPPTGGGKEGGSTGSTNP
ncbi:MAG: Thrombospondin 3-like protein [Parcubacteria group bacterium Gr01-1014_70]|nr:MAG: Thrombospondin 3-like protein [Parcubacteria group bacterium Gr01-1014_70]